VQVLLLQPACIGGCSHAFLVEALPLAKKLDARWLFEQRLYKVQCRIVRGGAEHGGGDVIVEAEHHDLLVAAVPLGRWNEQRLIGCDPANKAAVIHNLSQRPVLHERERLLERAVGVPPYVIHVSPGQPAGNDAAVLVVYALGCRLVIRRVQLEVGDGDIGRQLRLDVARRQAAVLVARVQAERLRQRGRQQPARPAKVEPDGNGGATSCRNECGASHRSRFAKSSARAAVEGAGLAGRARFMREVAAALVIHYA
jgi:hypothetical protein